jgi:hypothetical protein
MDHRPNLTPTGKKRNFVRSRKRRPWRMWLDPWSLSAALDPNEFEISFACDLRCQWVAEGFRPAAIFLCRRSAAISF